MRGDRSKRGFDIEAWSACGGAVTAVVGVDDPAVIQEIPDHLKKRGAETVGPVGPRACASGRASGRRFPRSVPDSVTLRACSAMSREGRWRGLKWKRASGAWRGHPVSTNVVRFYKLGRARLYRPYQNPGRGRRPASGVRPQPTDQGYVLTMRTLRIGRMTYRRP